MAGKNNINKEKIALQISELWNTLNEEQFKVLLKHLNVRKYKKSEIIYKNDEKTANMWFLVHGKVKIYKDGISGRNQIIRAIKPMEFFGFRAYFAEEDYKTSAMAIDACTVAYIPMETFMQLLKTNYNIGIFFIKYLSVAMGESDERTINLTQKHIRARLAEALIYLKNSYGLEEDGYTLSIYLCREDLANLSNMTTSNAIRTLSAFANEKLIAIDGRKIKIIKGEELLRISQQG